MKIRSFVLTLSALAATLAALNGGCQQKSTTVAQPAIAAESASDSPEESFQAIFESFRRGVEEVPIGFVVPDAAGGHSMMTGKNQVSYELIPPEADGGQYKGIISVTSESRYSVQRSTEEPGKSDQGNKKDNATAGILDAEEGTDTEIFDSAVASIPTQDRSTSAATPGKNKVVVASEENKTERKYELAYEKGRWVLTTKLDPKTEKSIQHAFDRALDTQN